MKIWAGENYPVRMGRYRGVIRVLRVVDDPEFGLLVTYRFVAKSGAAKGPEWCWPISWFTDFEVPLTMVARTAQADAVLSEVGRDELSTWWSGLLARSPVPLWIAQDARGSRYQG